jgi:hypothetical protein
LQAEGLRQAKILEAEGLRLAIILEAQGEAQKLRVISVGAAPLDSKALTVLSLDALKSMGNGQATKIIFPFELTRLVEGVSEYLGVGRLTPQREVANTSDLERSVGKADDVLGPIPKPEELRREMKAVEDLMAKEKIEAEQIAEVAKKDKMTSRLDKS